MLVACRLAGLSALEGHYAASTSAYKSVGGGPSAPQAREPSLSRPGIGRAGLQALATAWHS